MSDYSISIVPRLSNYPNNKIKAKEILDWLVSKDIVKPDLTDCVLSSDNGYPISQGAKKITNNIEQLPFQLITNGLDIITKRYVFHTGQNGMDKCICPNCIENIANEDWDFFNDWHEENSEDVTCPLCKKPSEIHSFQFSPEWGFSDLGFIFWNWPEFTNEFIEEFKNKLACDISIVYSHI